MHPHSYLLTIHFFFSPLFPFRFCFFHSKLAFNLFFCVCSQFSFLSFTIIHSYGFIHSNVHHWIMYITIVVFRIALHTTKTQLIQHILFSFSVWFVGLDVFCCSFYFIHFFIHIKNARNETPIIIYVCIYFVSLTFLIFSQNIALSSSHFAFQFGIFLIIIKHIFSSPFHISVFGWDFILDCFTSWINFIFYSSHFMFNVHCFHISFACHIHVSQNNVNVNDYVVYSFNIALCRARIHFFFYIWDEQKSNNFQYFQSESILSRGIKWFLLIHCYPCRSIIRM